MKVCKNCGTTLDDNEDFCVICESYQNKNVNAEISTYDMVMHMAVEKGQEIVVFGSI